MLKLGQYQTLKIQREAPQGLYLISQGDNEVLLPNKYVPKKYEIGEEMEVFVYLDHEERPVATTLKPYVVRNDFAYLRCVETTDFGAFLDWGLEKHLFVPFKEQAAPMKKNSWYLIHCYMDKETLRLAASSKVNQFTANEDIDFEPFQKVSLWISNPTDIGYNVIIDNKHLGLLYHTDIFKPIKTGDKLVGWIKKIREDNKIDVVLQRPGYRSIEPNADKIMEVLEENDGFLKLHDKSTPEEIQNQLAMSKTSFKRAVGKLYKKRMIKIVPEEGIYLL